MSRIPSWTAALPFVALVASGCAETTAVRPSSANVAQTCAGIPDAQARAFVTDLRADVERVETVREPTKTKPFVVHTVGADVYVRATPGMTTQWLTRLTQCHLVREGCGASQDHSSCPLGVAGTTVDVSSTSTGFVVAVRSSDFVAAQEIVRRANALLGTPGERAGGRDRPAAPADREHHASL